MKKWVMALVLIFSAAAVYAKGVNAEKLLGKWADKNDSAAAFVFEANNKFIHSDKNGVANAKWELLDDEILLLTFKNNGAIVLKTYKIKKCNGKELEIKLLFVYDVQKELTTVPEKGAKTSKFVKK